MNSYDAEYKKKLTSPETAMDRIGSGDMIVVGMSNAEPPALLEAIAARVRADVVKGLNAYTMSPMAHLANTLFAPDSVTASGHRIRRGEPQGEVQPGSCSGHHQHRAPEIPG